MWYNEDRKEGIVLPEDRARRKKIRQLANRLAAENYPLEKATMTVALTFDLPFKVALSWCRSAERRLRKLIPNNTAQNSEPT